MNSFARTHLFSIFAARIATVAGISLLVGCANTISVHQLPDTASGAIGKNGFFYTLPKSVLKLTVRVKKTDVTPSPQFDKTTDEVLLKSLPYPIRFFAKQDSSYELVSITPELVAVPDSKAVFFVQARQRNNPLLEKRFNFEFDAEAGNTLKSATFQSKDNLIPTLLTVAQTVLQALPLSADESFSAHSVVTTQRPAQRLLAVQTKRRALLDEFYKNPPPKNFDPKLVDGQLKQMLLEEETLVNLLRGTKTDSIYTYTLYKELSAGQTDLFRIDKKKGLLDTTKTTGDLFSLSVTPVASPPALPVWTTRMTSDITYKGIYYRVPRMARLQIRDSTSRVLYYDAYNIPIPQLGQLAFLPARVGVLSNDLAYQLDPKTGALLGFKANQDGEKTLDSSSTSVLKMALDKLKAPTEQENLDKDVIRLKSQKEILELRQKIDSLSTKK